MVCGIRALGGGSDGGGGHGGSFAPAVRVCLYMINIKPIHAYG